MTTGTGSGTGALTLANGLTDGFQKTIDFTGNGEEDFTLTPAAFGDGTMITFSNGSSPFAGAVILQWDAVAVKWWIVAIYQGTLS